MSRFSANKLSYRNQEKLFRDFCRVIKRLRTETAIGDFFKDLLNRHERMMIVRRLLVAKMLLADKTYREIRTKLKVGSSTIARIERWLNFGRKGILRALKK